MGYFASPAGDPIEDKLKAALTDIELWEELDHRAKQSASYLISGFVKGYIKESLLLLKREQEKQNESVLQ